MDQSRKPVIYALITLSISMGALEVILNLNDDGISDTTRSLWGFIFIVLSIMWAYADARQRNFHKPFDFGFLAYVLWPIVFPWYLVTTRGIKGILLFFGFLTCWLGPWLAGLITYVYFR